MQFPLVSEEMSVEVEKIPKCMLVAYEVLPHAGFAKLEGVLQAHQFYPFCATVYCILSRYVWLLSKIIYNLWYPTFVLFSYICLCYYNIFLGILWLIQVKIKLLGVDHIIYSLNLASVIGCLEVNFEGVEVFEIFFIQIYHYILPPGDEGLYPIFEETLDFFQLFFSIL